MSRSVLLWSARSNLLRFSRKANEIGLRSQTSSAAVKSEQLPSQDAKAKKMERPVQESNSFMFNLFRGVIATEQVFPYPDVMNADQKEMLQMLVDPTERFFIEKNDAAWNDENEMIPQETMDSLKELGAFGLLVPTEYGGLGLCNTQYARLGEILGAYDLGLSITLGAHQSIGYKVSSAETPGPVVARITPSNLHLLECQEIEFSDDGRLQNGCLKYSLFWMMLLAEEKIVDEYDGSVSLPSFPSSEHSYQEYRCQLFVTIRAVCSDAASIRSKAIPTADGKHFILNGSKIWISNGNIADVFTVFAQTPVKDEKTGK
ncbi:unnamed protein product [Cyprideis torosa]|uniref:Uncharacterized protein n=1 Tax=Cyprideis torosa TaxID=163714 RepID=A0A7R8WD67_9CRUS|nr:unnamed protein product [Cyprideis torosa]CAG0888254.1 unnamed protein product [Cyprideis torosa]